VLVEYLYKYGTADTLTQEILNFHFDFITTALANVSSVSQLFCFLVDCSGMILKGFSFVAFFAGVKASSFCIHLSCLVCNQSVVRGVWSRLFYGKIQFSALYKNVGKTKVLYIFRIVSLETECVKWSNPWCLWWWLWWFYNYLKSRSVFVATLYTASVTDETLVEWQRQGKEEVLREEILCHFANRKSHMYLPGVDTGPPRWGAGD
jgi:hypothetical protein